MTKIILKVLFIANLIVVISSFVIASESTEYSQPLQTAIISYGDMDVVSFYRSAPPRTLLNPAEEESRHTELLRARTEKTLRENGTYKTGTVDGSVVASNYKLFQLDWLCFAGGNTNKFEELDLRYCDFSRMVPLVLALINDDWPLLRRIDLRNTKNTSVFLDKTLWKNETFASLSTIDLRNSDVKEEEIKTAVNMMKDMNFNQPLRRSEGSKDCRLAIIQVLTSSTFNFVSDEVSSTKKWKLIKGVGRPLEDVHLKIEVSSDS